MDYEELYKIVLLGDAAVGKSHILARYIKGALPRNPAATIGVEFASKAVPLRNGGMVKAQIWDTAGQERYRSITNAHYRKAVGAFLVFDLTKRASFDSLPRWLEDLRQAAEPDIVIYLIGNKYDLVESNPAARAVTVEEANRFAKDNYLVYKEASAFTQHNIKESFETLMNDIYSERSKNKVEQLAITPSTISLTSRTTNRLRNASETNPLSEYYASCASCLLA